MATEDKNKKKRKRKGGFHKSLDLQKAIVLLSHLRDKHQIEINKVDDLFKSKGYIESVPGKLKSIIDCFVESSLPVKRVGRNLIWAGLFENTLVGKRLYQYCQSKEIIAKKVVDLLIDQEPKVRSALVGAGTSTLAVVKELVQRMNEIETLLEFYTNNLLVLNELIPISDLLNIRVPEGKIIMRDGAIISDEGLDSLKHKNYDVVITSFFGLSFDDGFSTDDDGDRVEKMMNLRPDKCSKIYIALSWDKFGSKDQVVATIEEGIDLRKKYIIVTDPPQNWQHNEHDKVEEFKKWSELIEKGVVKFEFVERK